jgi:hypothetical protein
MLGQFATNLADEIAPDEIAPDDVAAAAPVGGPAPAAGPAQPLDLLQATGRGVLGRHPISAVPVPVLLLAALSVGLVVRLVRRRRPS